MARGLLHHGQADNPALLGKESPPSWARRFTGSTAAPGKEAVAIKPVASAFGTPSGGSMPSGWTRWLLERFDFPFKVVYNLDDQPAGREIRRLILVEGAVGGGGKGGVAAARVVAAVQRNATPNSRSSSKAAARSLRSAAPRARQTVRAGASPTRWLACRGRKYYIPSPCSTFTWTTRNP